MLFNKSGAVHPTVSFRRSASTLAAVFAAALLAAPPAGASAGVRFDPAAFFTGRTVSQGRLKIIFHSGVDVRVEGTGKVEGDGTLNLSEVVHEGNKPARTRTWRIRETAPGHYSGTLSDAKGPVTGEVSGDRLHLAFTSLDGYGYDQWITIAPDGHSARNLLKISKMGMNVAEIDETIHKVD
jgi:hypothetical protein